MSSSNYFGFYWPLSDKHNKTQLLWLSSALLFKQLDNHKKGFQKADPIQLKSSFRKVVFPPILYFQIEKKKKKIYLLVLTNHQWVLVIWILFCQSNTCEAKWGNEHHRSPQNLLFHKPLSKLKNEKNFFLMQL